MSNAGQASVRKYRGTLKGRLALAKQDARRRKLKWDLLDETALALLKQPCGYCGAARADTLDRAWKPWGFIPGNVVPCCARCRAAKGDMDKGEFIMWVCAVAARLTRT